MTHPLVSTTKALALQWHITRFEGQDLQWQWTCPAHQTGFDLATMFEDLGLPLSPQEQERQVRFYWVEDGGCSSLALEHGCTQLRCSLNGQWLPAGQWVRLQQGDVLDVGLCRLELNPSECQDPPFSPPLQDLDLTTLAGNKSARTTADKMFAPADAMDDLLAATPWCVTDRQVSNGADMSTDRPKTMSVPQEPETWATSTIADGLLDPEQDALLRQWHAQYLRRLQTPHEALPQKTWTVGVGSNESHVGDDWDELLSETLKGPDLSALLRQDTQISSVLMQLDEHGASDVLNPPENVNVMHLFAPEGWSAATVSDQVPLLSRQEHHRMALDSALSVFIPDAGNQKP